MVELNASDTRSEKSLKAAAGDMTSNTSIADFAAGHTGGGGSGAGGGGGGGGGAMGGSRRMALIMDEVDGMSGGDRGGTATLIKVIASSKVPIICICNDRQVCNGHGAPIEPPPAPLL